MHFEMLILCLYLGRLYWQLKHVQNIENTSLILNIVASIECVECGKWGVVRGRQGHGPVWIPPTPTAPPHLCRTFISSNIPLFSINCFSHRYCQFPFLSGLSWMNICAAVALGASTTNSVASPPRLSPRQHCMIFFEGRKCLNLDSGYFSGVKGGHLVQLGPSSKSKYNLAVASVYLDLD